jgi:FKBP-type peptidyl-prolyl cis-trans isomerase (trigger factor)
MLLHATDDEARMMRVAVDGYHLTRPLRAVTDADVEQHLDAVREQHASFTEVDGSPGAGQRVRATIAFRPAGSAAPYETYDELMIMAGGRGDPATERLLATMRPGETRHAPDLAMEANTPRRLDVRLTLHTVELMTPAVLTNALVWRIARCRTVAEYRRAVRASIARQYGEEADREVRAQLFAQMAARHPETPVDEAKLAALLSQAAGPSPEDLPAQERAVIQRRVRSHVVGLALLDQLVAERQLAPTAADIHQRIKLVAQSRRLSAAQARRDLEQYGHMPDLIRSVGQEKAIALLLAQNPPTVTERVA